MPSKADRTEHAAPAVAGPGAPVRRALRRAPHTLLLWFGLGSLWICLQSSGFYPLSVVPDIGRVAAPAVARMHLVYACVLVAVAAAALVARRPVSRAWDAPWPCAAMGVCGLVGHGLLVLADPSAGSFAVQAVAGSVLAGCFIALGVLMWGARSSEGSAAGALLNIAASYLTSQAVLALYCACGLSQAYLMLACPVVCALGCWAYGGAAGGRPGEGREAPAGSLRAVPWRLVVPALFLVYFCVIFVRLLVTSFSGDASPYGKALAAAVCLAAFAVVVVIVRFAPVGESNKLAVSFAFLAVLYMAALVAMLLLDGHENFYVRRVLVASEHCVDALVWMALAYAVAARGVSPRKAFGFYLVAVMAVPWVLSFDAFYLLGLDQVVLGNEILLPAVSIASFVAALGLVGFLLISLLRGGDAPARSGALADGRSDAAGAVLGEAGLTPRELDVALLVYRGYSARRIGDELGLSEATVKSYTSHVYRKLDVHSKQEYIACVEQRLEGVLSER